MTIEDLITAAKLREHTSVWETHYLSIGIIYTIYSKDHCRFLFLNHFINPELTRIEKEGGITANMIIDCLDHATHNGRVNICYNKNDGIMIGW